MSSANAEQDKAVSISDLRMMLTSNTLWSKEYQINGYNLEVEIPIIVPEINKAPILTVKRKVVYDNTRLNFEEEDGASVEGDSNDFWIKKTVKSGEHNDPEKWRNDEWSVHVQADEDGTCDKFAIRYNNKILLMSTHPNDDLNFTWDYFYPYEIDACSTYAENNPLSVEQAYNSLNELLCDIIGVECPFNIRTVGVASRGRTAKGQTVDYYPKGSYKIEAVQKFAGIPILMSSFDFYDSNTVNKKGNPIKKNKSLRERVYSAPNCSAFYYSMLDEDSFTFSTEGILEIDREIENDVPLASFDTIIKRIEEQIANGRIKKIYSLQFGYAMYLDPNAIGIGWLCPIWQLECDWIDNKSTKYKQREDTNFRQGKYYKKIAINAQTGEVINPYVKSTSITMYDCPNYNTWKN